MLILGMSLLFMYFSEFEEVILNGKESAKGYLLLNSSNRFRGEFSDPFFVDPKGKSMIVHSTSHS